MARIFGLLATVLAMAIGLYLYAHHSQSIADTTPGGTLQSAPILTGVKGDLLSIANAERMYMAQQGKYASFDDLVSAHYISIHTERPPYSYDVQTGDNGFRVTATRSGPGGPAQLWIDETMQIQSSN
jgi:hypothetical protein